jgi:hypothetical protein
MSSIHLGTHTRFDAAAREALRENIEAAAASRRPRGAAQPWS